MSSPSVWKYARASELGTSHADTNTPCQDYNLCKELRQGEDDSVMVAVVSDGAGSACFSDIGSRLACELFIQQIERFLSEGQNLKDINDDVITSWVNDYQVRIRQEAVKKNTSPRNFACTFLATLISEDCAKFVQIGDGAIVLSDAVYPEPYVYVYWPEQGEYANQTYFLTDNTAQQSLKIENKERRIEEVALFTDGIQHLALHYQSKSVYIPFFNKMFEPLRKSSANDSELLSQSLSRFLNSSRVNERTDDDKTLVLLSRRTLVVATSPSAEQEDLGQSDEQQPL